MNNLEKEIIKDDEEIRYLKSSIDSFELFIKNLDSLSDQPLNPEREKEQVWGVLRQLDVFLRRVIAGSSEHLEVQFAFVKSAIDKMQEEIAKGGDIIELDSHFLSHALNPILDDFYLLGKREMLDDESIKKIMEFCAKVRESIGQFEYAYELYKNSYPEKYEKKLADVDISREYFPNFKAYIKGEKDLVSANLKSDFLNLISDISTSSFMKVDAKDTALKMCQFCIELIKEKI